MNIPDPNLSSPQPATPARRKGLKLPIYVTVPLVLLVVLCGAGFVWSQFRGPKPADLSQFEPNDTPAARVRSRLFNQATTRAGVAVVRREDGSGDVHIVGARARFVKAKQGWRLNLAYLNQGFIPPPNRQAIAARFIAMSDKTRAAAADITPEQVKQLRALKISNEMAASDADRKILTDLWTKYASALDAERPAIEQKLTEALRQTALSSISTTTAAAAQAAKEIHAILTPEQYNALNGAARPRRATTVPAK